MPTPPVVQAVRVHLNYKETDGALSGNRFHIAYSGSAPTPGNCATLAGDISSAWNSNLASLVNVDWSLYEVDVLDLASETGASGQDDTIHAGTSSGTVLPANSATNVEFDIARRYRGGKPRIYLPPTVAGNMLDPGHWQPSFISGVNTQVAAFFAAIAALSIGSMGTLNHVNISFYNGVYTTTPPWRGPGYKYPPKYRTTPLVDNISGYSCKAVIGSQRRRRTASSP